MTKRSKTIDFAKGLMIFNVAGTHIARKIFGVPAALLYPYCLTAFFILSGYFYKPGKTYLENIKRRFKQVFVPFLLYGFIGCVIFFIYRLLLGNPTDILEALKSYVSYVIDPFAFKEIATAYTNDVIYSGLSFSSVMNATWFLSRLFGGEIVLYAIADKALENNKNTFISIFTLLTISVVLNLVLPYHLPFQIENWFAIAAVLLLGAWLRKINIIDYIENSKKDKKYWLMFVGSIVLYAFLFKESYMGMAQFSGVYGAHKGWSIYAWFFFGLVGTYWLLVVCSLLAKVNILSKVFCYLGKHTLTILCFHILIGQMILELFGCNIVYGEASYNPQVPFGLSVVVLFISIGLCLLIDYLKAKFYKTN